MENVPAAPAPVVYGYVPTGRLVKDVQVGGDTSRVRRFTFGCPAGNREFHVVGPALHATYAEPAVTSSPVPTPVRQVKGGALKSTAGKPPRSFAEACRLQGLPDGFDLPGFTMTAKHQAVGNGVPLAMGRAVARAVKEAMQEQP